MKIDDLKKFYSGFYLEKPAGNNAFSYDARKNRRLYVPALVGGDLRDLAISRSVAFSEVVDGVEQNRPGLNRFVHIEKKGKQFFVFDNHNHAFFFWLAAYRSGHLKSGRTLLHIDQHSDMREPLSYPHFSLAEFSLREVFAYTNEILNVGNFIQPALAFNLFSNVEFIDSSASFESLFSGDTVLDIDIDVFAHEMSYIDENLKKQRIRQYIETADFITVATSPFFMEQQEALALVRELLSPWSA